MKRFSFNLQKLLELREFEEKNAKTALAAAISEADRIKADLHNLAAERVRVNKNRNDRVDVRTLMALENYVKRLDVKKDELLENLAASELLIEQRRELFKIAMQKSSVLHKLKEKQFFTWRKENTKAEESALEDAAYSQKYGAV
ncbi:flagellar export protein FliJ [Treponema sp. OMZ 840]|uniref:flagellar export protein FliJ n=1 Tax=Treponema sp. OMZ 840 TaxID=244313 RepID=UPI003D911505